MLSRDAGDRRLIITKYRAGVEYVKAHGKLTGPHTVSCALTEGGEQEISAKHIMIATGEATYFYPGLPFLLLAPQVEALLIETHEMSLSLLWKSLF